MAATLLVAGMCGLRVAVNLVAHLPAGPQLDMAKDVNLEAVAFTIDTCAAGALMVTRSGVRHY